ncbi:uncharacterized protein K02A2.6-like [Cydia strobilella]|uniref:uncharacterized protein K02A2.6-like n=1 Tax=Cydia strobilella TaxID=1100964 RepID=UPI00300470E2
MQSFISAIKTLAVHCNFSDLERQLRDRLVLGVRDVRLRRELLKTDNLTFAQAVSRSVQYEQTVSDLYPQAASTSTPPETKPTTSTSTSEPMDTNLVNVGSHKRESACRHCGANHNPRGCKFARANCNYCKKVGHTVAVCWNRNKKKINLVEVDELDDSKEDFAYMNEILQVHVKSSIEQASSKIFTIIKLYDKEVQFEVDSGAARTVISYETWRNMQFNVKLEEAKINLISWGQHPIKLKGLAKVKVGYKGLEHELTIIVAKDKGPNILGRDWFAPLGIQVEGICWTSQVPEELQLKYPKVFSDQLGCYTGPPAKLILKSEAQPKFLKCRPIPYALKEEVKTELKRLEAIGVLTPVRYSDWATPLRIVRKEDGTLRICGDYRSTVNISINCDVYPLPTSTEAFQLLSGGKIFSKLDLKQAYTQMLVDKESAEILTWNTPLGLMKVNRLPFGVSAAPGIFQQVMSSQFADMVGVAVLLDDIVVTGTDEAEHAARLARVLQRIQELGFTININKCQFSVPSVTFLGYVLDAKGIHPCPRKIKEIQERPSPSDLKQLRAFLGLVNFYERFYRAKADILEPLHQLLKKNMSWKWGEIEEDAFKKAKQLLTSDLTLVQFDKNKEVILTCDASEYGVGALISHVFDDGQEKPIAMASRTMQPHERNYSQLDKEALAIIYALKKFREYLVGVKFTIVTDHKPLIGLLNPRKPIPDQISPRLLRWSLILASYNYDILYKPGQVIQNADGLSRWCSPDPVQEEAPLPEVLLLEQTPEGWTVSVDDIASETKKDELLKKVVFFALHGWPSESNDRTLMPYIQRKDAISVSKDCLLFSNRVIIPEKLQDQVLKIIHAPHAGMVQSKAYARAYVYWPGMDADITEIVERCEPCQLTRNNPPATFREWPMPEKAWQRLHIDFAGPFMNKTFLILVDAYSKWPEIEVMSSMSSAQVIQSLRKIFAEQGLPDLLVSDNGTAFVSDEFETFLKRNSIQHVTSPPYHANSNGQAERTVQTIKNKIKRQSDIPWPERVAKLLYHLRTTPSTVTGKTPAELLNNRKFRTALSTLHPDSNHSKKFVQASGTALRQFSIDQKVYIRKYNNNMEKWMKGMVVKRSSETIYEVRGEDGVVYRRHVDQIRARKDNSPDQNSETELPQDPMGSTPERWVRDLSQERDPPIVIPPESEWRDIIGF